MTDPTIITLISIGVTLLFMLGVPVFLVIGYWVIGISFRHRDAAPEYRRGAVQCVHRRVRPAGDAAFHPDG